MTLDDIRNMIEKDLAMDKTELDLESIKTPQIHSKYLNFLMDEKLLLTKQESDLKKLSKTKWLYYTGKMSQEELDFYGYEPFQLNILKQDIDKFMESDDEIIKLNNKVKYQKEKVYFLEETIKMINNRQWLIRSAIDWIKFSHGT